MYFVIYKAGKDTIIEPLTQDQLQQKLNKNFFGQEVEFLTEFPEYKNTKHWKTGKILIIKGEIQAPKPIKEIVRYEVD